MPTLILAPEVQAQKVFAPVFGSGFLPEARVMPPNRENTAPADIGHGINDLAAASGFCRRAQQTAKKRKDEEEGFHKQA